MIDTDIQRCFRDSLQSHFRLVPAGTDRYYVSNPFIQDDGDHLAIQLERLNSRWVFTDDGSTYMRLSYRMDLDSLFTPGNRNTVVQSVLRLYGVQDDRGVLIKDITHDDYGRALFELAQAMMRIMDVMYLSRSHVASTFMEDFQALVKATVPESRYTFNWHDPVRDPQALYTTDCRINGMPIPLYLFALSTTDRVKNSTITILTYKMWDIPMHTIGIYEDMGTVTQRAVDQLNAHCDRTYPSLKADRDQIVEFLTQAIA